MPDSDRAGQAVNHLAAGEALAHEAHTAVGVETLAVVGDDSGGFLAAMLEGVQSERRNRRRIRVPKHAEYAALLTQTVIIQAVCVGSFDRVAHRASKSSVAKSRVAKSRVAKSRVAKSRVAKSRVTKSCAASCCVTKSFCTSYSLTTTSLTKSSVTTSSLSSSQRTTIVPDSI